MITFMINGLTTQIPSTWNDLTFDQFLKVSESKGSVTEMIALFTGIDIETLKKASIEGLNQVMISLAFLKKSPEFTGNPVKIGPYKLPLNSKREFDIQFESLAQFEDMRAIMNAVPEGNAIETLKGMAKYCAIYLQKIRDKSYDQDKAMAMVEEVHQMPAHEVIAAGSFFFLKLLSLSTGTDLNSLTMTPNQKKSKPASRNSKKRSGRTRPYRKSR